MLHNKAVNISYLWIQEMHLQYNWSLSSSQEQPKLESIKTMRWGEKKKKNLRMNTTTPCYLMGTFNPSWPIYRFMPFPFLFHQASKNPKSEFVLKRYHCQRIWWRKNNKAKLALPDIRKTYYNTSIIKITRHWLQTGNKESGMCKESRNEFSLHIRMW